MANKQTKTYRKLGLSTRNTGASLTTIKPFDKFEGKPCVTDFKRKEQNPQNKRTSPWRGCKRNPAVLRILDQKLED